MSKTGPRLPGFCLNRIRPHVKVRSPSIQQSKPSSVSGKAEDNYQKIEDNINLITSNVGDDKSSSVDVTTKASRKILIVVDSSFEAKGALQWTLSHSVQNQDKVVLLYVTKPSSKSKQGGVQKDRGSSKAYDFVNSLKKTCQLKKPEINIEVAVVEGKEKGPTIVEEARKQEASLLVLGQKKRSMTWRLIMMWAGNKVTSDVVEYCIQNAECMALAVRRKNKKVGGYLITTKRHKDFWLLA